MNEISLNMKLPATDEEFRAIAYNIWEAPKEEKKDPTGFCAVCGEGINEVCVYYWFCSSECRQKVLDHHEDVRNNL